MANIKATIRQTGRLKGQAQDQKEIVAQTVKLSQGSIALGDLTDVDTSAKADGAVIVFNANTGLFELTNTVEEENLTISAGLY